MEKHYTDDSFHHILIIFGSLALFIVSNLYIMIPLLDEVANDFLISPSTASLSISVFSFFYAIGLVFFGSISERVGLKETICFGLFILIIFMFVSFFITNYSSFLIFRGIQGFWAASFAPVSFIYVLNVLSRNHQAMTIGVINSGFLAAGVIGQLLSSAVILLFQWKVVFLVLTFLYSLFLLYAIKMLPRPKKKTLETRAAYKVIKLLITLPFRSDLRRLYFITFTTLLSFVAYYTAIELLFKQSLFLLPKTAFIVRALGLISIILTVFSVKIASRIGFRTTIILGLSLKLIGIAFSSNMNVCFITFGSIIFVAGVAIIIPSLIQLIGHKSGENRSFAISMYSFILLLGASFGSAITIFSSYPLKLFILSVFLLCSLTCIIFEKLPD